MPYVGPASGQVIPRRSRRDKPSSAISTSNPGASSPCPSSSIKDPSDPSSIPPPSSGIDNPDMLTPRPNTHKCTIDTLSDNLAATTIDPSAGGPSRPRGSDITGRTDNRHGSDGTSKTSEADLSASESSTSLTSLSTQSEVGTPPTTSTTPDMIADVEARALGEAASEGVEDRVLRYREGLYAYTRNLYLEAKLVQSKKANGTGISQFGLKQSGMERLAAKKALARRLNA